MADLSSVTSGAAAPDFEAARKQCVAVHHVRPFDMNSVLTCLDAAESLLREQQQELARLTELRKRSVMACPECGGEESAPGDDGATPFCVECEVEMGLEWRRRETDWDTPVARLTGPREHVWVWHADDRGSGCDLCQNCGLAKVSARDFGVTSPAHIPYPSERCIGASPFPSREPSPAAHQREGV